MAIDFKPLERIRAGQPIGSELTATKLNAPMDAIDDLRRAYADNVGFPANAENIDGWQLGILTNEGPNEEADYTDNRYWVKWAIPDPTLNTGESLDLDPDDRPGIQDIITATNIAEPGSSHSLLTDDTTFVKVYRVSYGGSHFYFFERALPGVLVKITANASGGGKYTGPIMRGPSTALPTGNLAMAEGLNGGTIALILNINESGSSAHALALETYHIGTQLGTTADDDKRPIVYIKADPCDPGDTPTSIGGSGETLAEDTADWDYDDDGPNLSYTKLTRIGYKHDEVAPKFYAYYRTETYQCGKLVAVSAETRVEIDTPEEC